MIDGARSVGDGRPGGGASAAAWPSGQCSGCRWLHAVGLGSPCAWGCVGGARWCAPPQPPSASYGRCDLPAHACICSLSSEGVSPAGTPCIGHCCHAEPPFLNGAWGAALEKRPAGPTIEVIAVAGRCQEERLSDPHDPTAVLRWMAAQTWPILGPGGQVGAWAGDLPISAPADVRRCAEILFYGRRKRESFDRLRIQTTSHVTTAWQGYQPASHHVLGPHWWFLEISKGWRGSGFGWGVGKGKNGGMARAGRPWARINHRKA